MCFEKQVLGDDVRETSSATTGMIEDTRPILHTLLNLERVPTEGLGCLGMVWKKLKVVGNDT